MLTVHRSILVAEIGSAEIGSTEIGCTGILNAEILNAATLERIGPIARTVLLWRKSLKRRDGVHRAHRMIVVVNDRGFRQIGL